MILTKETDYIGYPIVICVICIIVALISYQIGFGFEKSEIGKPIVDTAKVIVDIDNNIDNIPVQVGEQVTNSISQST